MTKIVTKKQLREFGFLIGFFFPFLIGFVIPIMGGHNFRLWTLWIGITSFILGTFKPSVLRLPYYLWMKIGYILGWYNSRIILGLVFFLVLQPIAIIMKFLGHDPLNINFTNEKSYREITKNNKIDLTRIF